MWFSRKAANSVPFAARSEWPRDALEAWHERGSILADMHVMTYGFDVDYRDTDQRATYAAVGYILLPRVRLQVGWSERQSDSLGRGLFTAYARRPELLVDIEIYSLATIDAVREAFALSATTRQSAVEMSFRFKPGDEGDLTKVRIVGISINAQALLSDP